MSNQRLWQLWHLQAEEFRLCVFLCSRVLFYLQTLLFIQMFEIYSVNICFEIKDSLERTAKSRLTLANRIHVPREFAMSCLTSITLATVFLGLLARDAIFVRKIFLKWLLEVLVSKGSKDKVYKDMIDIL